MRVKTWRDMVVLIGFVSIVLSAGPVLAGGGLQVGDKSPDFPNPVASSAGDKPGAVKVTLADFIGQANIVLAFYVADWTGG